MRGVMVATDLDRTVIYTRTAFGHPNPRTVCVEHYDGQPLSYMTAGAAQRLSALAETAAVVPVTTRTIAQFQRVRLPGQPFPYAITSNGGTILRNGLPDRRWRSALEARVRAECAGLVEVRAQLRARVDESFALKLREADDLFCYLVVDQDRLPANFLADLDAWCRPRGWSASQQGRKIYAMPLPVCKSRAVLEVRRRLVDSGDLHPDAVLAAAGDGALDAEMLRVADIAIRPRHGELEQRNWTHPGVAVTRSTGIHAAEEILDYFLTVRAGQRQPASS
ncbi:HAD family hydrolase [Nocardia yunnanensis]|uniref:HAD family hydrolase n=1 Tax=Nocardia yunnanensis TaxID=2382165 RepID=A0A386ZEX9_9NOCA|nr:HAD family hydrolase [Nocardia yunnanensis]AYF76060.1 HAD family hydrolase [Nocardia yunnanensis]